MSPDAFCNSNWRPALARFSLRALREIPFSLPIFSFPAKKQTPNQSPFFSTSNFATPPPVVAELFLYLKISPLSIYYLHSEIHPADSP
jgi:hypothetical protein